MKEAFLLRKDEFGEELVRKVNERFPYTLSVWLDDFHAYGRGRPIFYDRIGRAAVISTIANDSHLRSLDCWPITPEQSEILFQVDGLPPYRSKNYEILGIVSQSPQEVDIRKIKQDVFLDDFDEICQLQYDIFKKRNEFNLTRLNTIRYPLLVVNPGLDFDNHRYIVIPGVSQVLPLRVLRASGSYNFESASDQGLPREDEIRLREEPLESKREFKISYKENRIQIRELLRFNHGSFCVQYCPRSNPGPGSEITFVREVS